MFTLSKVRRLNRRSFIANIVVGSLLLICIAGIIATPTGALNENPSGGLLGAIGIIAMVLGIGGAWVLIIICMVYRLHDLGATGWLSATVFIPFIGFITGAVLIFAPGQEKKNIWGTRSRKLEWLFVQKS
jgi:uncharacterized membrane protein YhaH (DUF805 family)